MKKSLLSLAIILIALFTINTAFISGTTKKQNAHFVKGPCLDGRSIKGTIAGLGSGTLTITVDGSFVCVNRGGNEPTPKNFSLTSQVESPRGGNFKLNFDVSELCPNRNFTFRVDDLHITISNGSTELLNETFSGTLPSCR